ncbi:CRISPR-associated endoribonuclease Cas6 [Petralouisia muris]|uniref:CRISPR-associated endoribonuclease Cas6 n=1 Tax=Petralouisia muris TaxID=3032872 RepID=A0AC61RZ48_9FIRM|nr:CRISPR-associated endoribonuclease Cas6 [Petralouisia muris]TGY97287.1 CRISPR-associated endoribonuclease Cas6 [Petralouisia muris]
MLANLKMELKTEENDFIPYQKAVILQGILMEQVREEYAAKLHVTGLHPYSQSITNLNGRNIWNICTANEEAFQEIMLPFQEERFSDFYMEDDKWKVSVVQKQLFKIEKKEFMEQYYFENSDRYIQVSFQTPTAFKSQGEYVCMPTLQLIYQSLMKKYDAASDDETVESGEVLEQLLEYSRIVQYQLRSSSYSVHGKRIPAFMGQMKIKVSGPQAMVNFLNLLFHFGEYTGIGIKTAMGMGAVKLIEGRKG